MTGENFRYTCDYKRENRLNVTSFLEGRTTGIEPANGGTTIHCLSHLATLAIAFLTIAFSSLIDPGQLLGIVRLVA